MWPQKLPSQFCLAATWLSESWQGGVHDIRHKQQNKTTNDQRWSFGFVMPINKFITRQRRGSGGGNLGLSGCCILIWGAATLMQRSKRQVDFYTPWAMTASPSGKSGSLITMAATLPNTDVKENFKPLAGLPLRIEQLQQLDPPTGLRLKRRVV